MKYCIVSLVVFSFLPEVVFAQGTSAKTEVADAALLPLDFQGGHAVTSELKEFLGAPLLVPMQKLWDNRGGWGGIVTATDGTVVAFQSPGGGTCRRSRDGGKTWDAEILIAADATKGRGLVDESDGSVLFVNLTAGWLFRSRDAGATWTRETVQVRPDGFGNVPGKDIGVAAMQSGITLAYSKRYTSREHMTRGNRFLAHSDDGGDLWLGAYRSLILPDGARGTSYGCLGGMIRLAVAAT